MFFIPELMQHILAHLVLMTAVQILRSDPCGLAPQVKEVEWLEADMKRERPLRGKPAGVDKNV
jgi:hypothetical protein